MKNVDPPAGLRDLGLERQRLTQQLRNRGRYDPDGLAELGALSLDMGDLFHAGRVWLFSNAGGEQVEQVIDYFAERCGRRPHAMLSQAPMRALKDDFAEYPEVVRGRLTRFGVSSEHVRQRRKPKSEPTSWRTTVLVSVLFVLGLAVFLLGVVTVMVLLVRWVGWIFGG